MKKFLLFLFAFLLIPNIVFASFPDVSADHENAVSIQWLQDNGVVEGYSDGSFKPEKLVNRVEFLKMLYEIIGMHGYQSVVLPFEDVPKGEWFIDYIKEAYVTGVVDGYPDGTFKPGNYINIVEAMKIVANAFFDVEELYGGGDELYTCAGGYGFEVMSEWYGVFLWVLDNKCIIPENFSGTLGFDFSKNVTRGQMAELLYRAKSVVDNDLAIFHYEIFPDIITYNDVGIIEGSLSYPSEFIPEDMYICAEDVNSNVRFCTGTHIYDENYVYGVGYRLEVPKSDYYVFSALPGDDYQAFYSEYIRCGQSISCTNHLPIVVKAVAGEILMGIDPMDWYVF